MKDDRKLLVATAILIGLVVWLLVLTISNKNEQQVQNDAIKSLQQKVDENKFSLENLPKPVDGKTPVLGVDYTVKDGKNATYQQVQTAVNSYMLAHPITQPSNGSNGSSAYDLAVQNGFTGSVKQWLDTLKVKGDKGDSAPELQLDCSDGHIATKYSNDHFWQLTPIKCEEDQ